MPHHTCQPPWLAHTRSGRVTWCSHWLMAFPRSGASPMQSRPHAVASGSPSPSTPTIFGSQTMMPLCSTCWIRPPQAAWMCVSSVGDLILRAAVTAVPSRARRLTGSCSVHADRCLAYVGIGHTPPIVIIRRCGWSTLGSLPKLRSSAGSTLPAKRLAHPVITSGDGTTFTSRSRGRPRPTFTTISCNAGTRQASGTRWTAHGDRTARRRCLSRSVRRSRGARASSRMVHPGRYADGHATPGGGRHDISVGERSILDQYERAIDAARSSI